ncbi:MAG: sigma-54-dependent Fis family transcriptional regulator [Desulfobacteraceae bacterium]|nr:sigma-54-dependent Fis family transcriptional regulator [Desulfobacteraceae bacterium]
MNETKKTLLIIDDDQLFCDSVSTHFNGKLNTMSANTGKSGVELCSKHKIDIILLDQKLPDGNGTEFCRLILKNNESVKIIFITAYPSFSKAVKAIKIGAYNYLSKPFELEELELAVMNATRTIDLEHVEHIQSYKNTLDKQDSVLVGEELSEVKKMIQLASKNMSNVLITGETGTGKGIVAKAIHYQSYLDKGPFIIINCAAFPENLIESELFGHEKGAFTGADIKRIGIFEMAQDGTLFLDEIGDLPLHLQSKLLTVLDEKVIRRIGGRSDIPINVRIIAATNTDIEERIKNKEFRSDLYYRLSLIRIHIGPLRERVKDIEKLSLYFTSKFRPDLSLSIPQAEIEKLKKYDWPGNIRELRNIIERTIILRTDSILYPGQYIQNKSYNNTSYPSQDLSKLLTLQEIEKRHIGITLNKLEHNKTHSAKSLGISRSTLMRKIKEYNL